MPKPLRTLRPVRVAHIIQNLNYGGMERVLNGLASELPARGFEVHVVALEYLGRFAEGLGPVATLHNPSHMGRLSLLWPSKLIRLLRSIQPDIVHSHTGVWLKAARAARAAGTPVVLHTEHGRPAPVPVSDRLLDNLASRSTDTVIAVSSSLAALLRDQVVTPRTPIHVIQNGIDVSHLTPTSEGDRVRASMGLPPHALVIGSVGRLEPVKNYGVAIRALARLLKRQQSVPLFLVLAGDGSQRNALERLACDLGVQHAVRFLGWRDDAHQLYRAYDVFTLTSDSEGTSISLLEAMSTAVCPAVTDVGGNAAVLGNDLASHVVPPGDDEAMADLWHRLLINAEERGRAGRRCRERVVAHFSLERMVDDHAQLYAALLARPSRIQASSAMANRLA